MTTAEQDPKQPAFDPIQEGAAGNEFNGRVPARGSVRMAIKLPDWWRELVLSGVPRTEADVERLKDWFGEQLAGSPLDASQHLEDEPEAK